MKALLIKFIEILISAITPKILESLRALWHRWRHRKNITEKNGKVTNELKNAKTSEEKDKAAQSVIDNF